MCQTSFEEFKPKRELWIQCFSEKDRNSIMQQLYHMIWNAAVFKLICESRKNVPIDARGHKEINGMLHNFIDRCFFDSQFLAIRRLTDKAYKLEDEKRGIFSLPALLEDMKKNISLITRSNLFLAEGLEYDCKVVQKKLKEYERKQLKNEEKGYWIPSELNVRRIISRHKEIDLLCGVDKNNRKLNDTIKIEILEHFITKIQTISKNVNLYIAKYVAHAASLRSRETYNEKKVSITLDHLWDMHKIICQIAGFISVYFLSGSTQAFLAIPQYNHFVFIDKTLFPNIGVDTLRKTWGEFEESTNSWGLWNIEDLQKEIKLN